MSSLTSFPVDPRPNRDQQLVEAPQEAIGGISWTEATSDHFVILPAGGIYGPHALDASRICTRHQLASNLLPAADRHLCSECGDCAVEAWLASPERERARQRYLEYHARMAAPVGFRPERE